MMYEISSINYDMINDVELSLLRAIYPVRSQISNNINVYFFQINFVIGQGKAQDTLAYWNVKQEQFMEVVC